MHVRFDCSCYESCSVGNAGIEDSSSQYLFACTNPRVLKLPQSISGQHKLWTLPAKVLAAAQQGLKPVPTKWRASGKDAPSKITNLDLWPLPKYHKPELTPFELNIKP